MAIVANFTPQVAGSSQLADYTGWIDVLSISCGLYSPVSVDGGGMSAGKSSLSEIAVTVNSGKHMPEIVKQGTGGKHFDKIEFVFLKQTGDATPQKYKSIVVEQAYVTSHNDPTSADDPGYEHLSIACAKMTTEYFEQNAQGGLVSAGTASYDTKTGQTS
ncbi:MAG TPA: type VI secretion system tube protein Hcp [Pyrinomonadaceae bacterium]|jgi:type VI protein secretion system component Hcp|nr:type VI secretion system tube protein Hcp [Pyrinomonadaceae bacterium]